MAKYRICPNCGAKNRPSLLFCEKCGSDSLEYEKIIDDSVEAKVADLSHETTATNDVSNAVKMVRICDCGTHNPVNVRKCSNCGEDISFITPVNELEQSGNQSSSVVSQEQGEEVRFILSTLDGEYAYEITENITVVGRECSMNQYLASKKYVSRRHAELLRENGKVYIKNLSSTNYTYVNNEKIEDQKYVELKDGDELGLGGKVVNDERQNDAAYFMVRVGTCM
ncbi:FHA domain-containing protein [Butyrivibrio sp.]|jgi:ribosomal protein L40E|uniref:FHA domain-containing protein n=1 Tax=Butyrivibrio sp. TaxID=28121 RepID=UPI0025B83A9F|nr:FHA domain-containing protein [Butyrivibrio sp.]MBE5837975.1 FHA domain-containing protein [Butyrivibrio sp.]